MNITIQQLDERNFNDLNRGDRAFTVDSRLILQAENDAIGYTVASIPPFQKRYPVEELDYAAYLHHPDKAIFLAYAGGQLAGQIIVRKNWNRCAYIEDIVVDAGFRREGAGRALLQHAVGQNPTVSGRHAGNPEQQCCRVPPV
jgi:GNAT superfamily N-acetyltransferase